MSDEIIPPNPAPKRDSWGAPSGMPKWLIWLLVGGSVGGGGVTGVVGMVQDAPADVATSADVAELKADLVKRLERVESKIDAQSTIQARAGAERTALQRQVDDVDARLDESMRPRRRRRP